MSTDNKTETPKTEPCPICGEAITTNAQARLAHVKACADKRGKEATVTVAYSELDKQIEQAKKIAEIRRKQAPNVAVSTVEDNSGMGMKEQLVKALGLVPEGWSMCWRRVDLRAVNVSKGYVPLKVDGDAVRENELELYIIPKDIIAAQDVASGRESKSRLGELLKTGDKGSGVEKTDVPE